MTRFHSSASSVALLALFSASLFGCREDDVSALPPTQGDATLCEIKTTSNGPQLFCPDEDPLPVSQPGAQGEPGTPGQNGSDGMAGRPGMNGEDGQDGTDGIDGLDGQNVWVERTVLEEGSELCPGGGQLIELFQGEVDETPDAAFEVCDVVCSQGELYEPDYGQCIKFTQIEFEGSLWRIVGDFPESYAPSELDPDTLIGLSGTPCSGKMVYPFKHMADIEDDFTALYRFGDYQNAGLTLTIGDRTYARDLSGELEPAQATMFRSAYPIFGDQAQLSIEVQQTSLSNQPSGYSASILLTGGDDDIPFDEAQAQLVSPDRAQDWLMLQDDAIEQVALEVVNTMTEGRARLVCRISHFK